MNKRNYQKELEKILDNLQEKVAKCAFHESGKPADSDSKGKVEALKEVETEKKIELEIETQKETETEKESAKHLLLHSCCAPCSSYVLDYLSRYFHITVLYYNPNITASSEYFKRVEEQKRLIEIFNQQTDRYIIDCIEGDYVPQRFLELTKGMEECPEGGERCFLCYRMRLEETARVAKEIGADYFTTTLTISPLKNARKLNEIGEELADAYQIPWLPSDFKKKEGYKRSVELSAEYGLYRQDYCGCAYSKVERERQKSES